MLDETADMMHCGSEDAWRQREKTEGDKRERNNRRQKESCDSNRNTEADHSMA